MLTVRSAVVGPFALNAYLAGCSETGEAVLIDPGAELDRVLALREPGPFQVKRILLTHGHVDHAAGAAEARRRTGAPVACHPDDHPWLEALPRQAAMFGLDAATPLVPDAPLADGERVRVGNEEAIVIHTPGHCRGSVCLWFERAGVLFTGDTLFAGSVGRTDLPGGDFEQLAASITGKLFALGDDVRFYPGHGPDGRLGDERRDNPFVGERARRSGLRGSTSPY
jgi:glyoxylase-like metal-dependent hydrolase (beta-lactamase superfamily II)